MNNFFPMVILLIIIFLSFKTICKTVKKTKVAIDIKWIKRYVIKREIARIFLAPCLLVMAYFYLIFNQYPHYKFFRIFFVLSIYILIRSVIHIVFACLKGNLIKIQVEKCITSMSGDSESDVDTSSPMILLSTDKGDYTFHGYGPSVYMASNLDSGDTLINVRFKFGLKPHMLIGIPKSVEQQFDMQQKYDKKISPKTKRRIIIGLVIAVILAISFTPSTPISNIEKIEEILTDKYLPMVNKFSKENETNKENEIDYKGILGKVEEKYKQIPLSDKIDKIFVSYDSANEIQIPYLHDGYGEENILIFVTHYESEANTSSWVCIDTKKEALIYFDLAKELGTSTVICKVESDSGIVGFSCNIDEVITGYLNNTWSFAEAEKKFKEVQNN